MISHKRKFLAFCVFAAALFAMVTSGGCGSSSHDDFISDNPITIGANSVLSGVWRIDTSASTNSISADINGTTVNLATADFVIRFANVDVENDNGTLSFDAVAILSSDRVILPMAIDNMSAGTEALDNGEWSMEGRNVNYLMSLSGTTSNPSLRLLGNMQMFGSASVSGRLTFKKVTHDADMTNAEMDSLINGTWQTPINRPAINGGFILTSGDRSDVPANADELERPADMPLVDGMIEIDSIFANYIFEETDTAKGTSRITSQVVLATMNASGDVVRAVHPVMVRDYAGAKITPMYDKVYKIELSSHDKAVLLVGDDNTTAYLVTASGYSDENGGSVATHTVAALEKKPGKSESTFSLTDQIGSVWSSTGLAAGEIRNPSSLLLGQAIKFDSLGLLFPADEADLANRTFTAKIVAQYRDAKPENASADAKLISTDIKLSYVERIGYNTWYADNGDDTTEGDNRIIISYLNNYAFVTAILKVNGKEVSIVAFLSRDGDAEDMFFSGAWQCYSNDAVVHLTNRNYFNGDIIPLLNFGVKFSSVDVDAGSANFSAVAVLSADLMLIPMVFDNEQAAVAPGSSANEYVVTTEHGTLTVSYDDDDPEHMHLSGTISYADTGVTVSMEGKLRRVLLGLPGQQTVESRQYDFAQVMNHSTWQTSQTASASGGFAIAQTSAGAMMYPATASKTSANIVFDGDNTGGTISGFGAIGLQTFDTAARSFVDKGTLVPVTMIKQNVNVSNIFANYYRFELASGDQDIKGVFIIDSEESARMIMFASNVIPNGQMRIYSMFTLNKVTETTQINLAAFNNTSWDIAQAGGFVLMPPAYSTPYTVVNSEPDEYSVSFSSADVSFSDANLSTRTFKFNLTAYFSVPDYAIKDRPFVLSREVVVEHLGAYTWYGKTTGDEANGSEFMLTIPAANPNMAVLAGNINFEIPSAPDTYAYNSMLLNMLRKQ